MVMKYYISVHNCLHDLRAEKSTIESFHNNLFTWIEKNVMPKLKDDKFYSAFGGILRVEESLKSLGKYVSFYLCLSILIRMFFKARDFRVTQNVWIMKWIKNWALYQEE